MPPSCERLRYPEHEARHPWLVRLLNAYHLADEAVRRELEREKTKRGAAPACHPGCHVCCVGQYIPVTVFEVLGLWWYCAEMLPPEKQKRLRVNLLAHAETPACPFLLEGECAVYPLRPVICREHYVFGAACRPGENLRENRPADVCTAGHEAGRDMAWELLPLYGVPEDDIDRRFENGYLGQRVKDLHSLPLANIVRHMDGAAHLRRKAGDA